MAAVVSGWDSGTSRYAADQCARTATLGRREVGMQETADGVSVVEQAEILRERVIRTAWALHFAAEGAADLARARHQHAPDVLGGDDESWWRTVSVRAIDLVHAWDNEGRAAGRA
jgi:hypothetical protein